MRVLHPLAHFLFVIASLLEDVEKKRAAYRLYRAALAFNRSDYVILCRVSSLLRSLGYVRIAREFAQEAVDVCPEAFDALYELGYCEYELENYIPCEHLYSHLRNHDAGNYLSSFWLGKARLQQGNYAGACAELRRARQMKNGDIAILEALAEGFVQSGSLQDAIVTLERACALDPKNRHIRTQLNELSPFV